MKTNNKHKNKGFTLVEVLVATFIFTSIMMVSISSLLATMSASKKARALRVAMDNVNFAMESMARSIRMGNYYHCSDSSIDIGVLNDPDAVNDCDSNSNKNRISFLAEDIHSNKTAYYLNTEKLYRIERGQTVGVPITSSEVKINKLKFIVEGSDPTPSDSRQPKVYIIMSGSVTVRGEDYPFALQTLASRRRYE